MPEDHARTQSLADRLRATLSARRGLRRLAASGLPAALAFAGVVPVMTDGPSLYPSFSPPSVVLCCGWQHCNARGFNSYGYAARGGRAYWRISPGDQCTNYAAYVESVIYHVRTPGFLLGNGGQWAYTAAAHGVRVNHTPSVGAVAEWDGGTLGIGPIGHVGVVEAVGPHRSYVVISQQHMDGRDGYNWTLIKAIDRLTNGRNGRATSSTSASRAEPAWASTTRGRPGSGSATRSPPAPRAAPGTWDSMAPSR